MKKSVTFLKKAFARQKLLNETYAKPGVKQIVLVLDNLKPDFNIGKIFRTMETLGGHEIHLVGLDYFDPYPAMGCFRKVPAVFHDSIEDCFVNLKERGYKLFAMDTKGQPQELQDLELPEKSAFIMGHEEFGLSFKLEDFPKIKSVKIKQYGETESLNVAVAASIALYEYTRQHP